MPQNKVDDYQSPHHRAQVQWGRSSGYVTVSTVWDDPKEPVTGWDGVFVQLDRAACNTMIRTLRKARDQAFGRDE